MYQKFKGLQEDQHTGLTLWNFKIQSSDRHGNWGRVHNSIDFCDLKQIEVVKMFVKIQSCLIAGIFKKFLVISDGLKHNDSKCNFKSYHCLMIGCCYFTLKNSLFVVIVTNSVY
jgi:hypothetical protein